MVVCITPCFAFVSLRCYRPTPDLRSHRRDSAAWHGWSQVLAGSLTYLNIRIPQIMDDSHKWKYILFIDFGTSQQKKIFGHLPNL